MDDPAPGPSDYGRMVRRRSAGVLRRRRLRRDGLLVRTQRHGFYTVAPGRPVYDIGCPLFEKSTIDLGGGKTFTVKAPDVSAQNKYIQSATLNGRPLDRPWFTHEELQQGGTLFLQMGPRPNRNWGANPEKMPFTDHDAPKN